MYQVRGNRFKVTWYDERGHRRSRTFKDKDDAMVFEIKRRKGEIDVLPSRREIPTFKEFAERWLREYCHVEKHESQWGKDRSVIERILAPTFGSRRLTTLRRADLEELKAKLRVDKTEKTSKPMKAKTVNNVLALIKKMMATAVDWELVQSNPFQQVKLLRLEQGGFDYWAVKERDTFLEKALPLDLPFTAAVLVACHTGLRLGELTALRISDLDFERRKIWVGASFNHELGRRFETVKGKRAAEVPMNPAVISSLEHLKALPPESQVFDRRLLGNARKRLGCLCKRVGVREIRFHDLRHTFGSHLAMAGVDLMRIKELMRHRSYQMTLRYAHLHPDHLRGATDVLCGAQMAPRKARSLKSGGPRGT